jgi:hypothetical protein
MTGILNCHKLHCDWTNDLNVNTNSGKFTQDYKSNHSELVIKDHHPTILPILITLRYPSIIVYNKARTNFQFPSFMLQNE